MIFVRIPHQNQISADRQRAPAARRPGGPGPVREAPHRRGPDRQRRAGARGGADSRVDL